MAALQQSASRNQLLARMSPEGFAALQPHLEPVELPVRKVLAEPNQPIEHVYFPEHGLASVTTNGGGSSMVEIGIVGWEGMVGVPIVLGTDRAPFQSFMQLAGQGLRIATAPFEAALREHPTLDRQLRRYAQVMNVQTSATAFANAEHTLEMRLARWLLMCHDRVDGDEVALTHEFLSMMLGVRRAGVTTSIHILEGNGLIRAKRGLIIIRDRERLEALADNAYGLSEAEYARLMAEGP